MAVISNSTHRPSVCTRGKKGSHLFVCLLPWYKKKSHAILSGGTVVSPRAVTVAVLIVLSVAAPVMFHDGGVESYNVSKMIFFPCERTQYGVMMMSHFMSFSLLCDCKEIVLLF